MNVHLASEFFFFFFSSCFRSYGLRSPISDILYPYEHIMHVPVSLSPDPSAFDICYLSVIYTLCTTRFFSLIPQPYPIQHSVLVNLRQDQIIRAFHAVIDWCGVFSYGEQSYLFFHCLSQGNDWVGLALTPDPFIAFLFTIRFWAEGILCF